MQNIWTVEIYPAVKENDMKFEGEWIEPGKYTSEVTQALKHKCHMFFLMCLSQLLMSVLMHVCGYEGRDRSWN